MRNVDQLRAVLKDAKASPDDVRQAGLDILLHLERIGEEMLKLRKDYAIHTHHVESAGPNKMKISGPK